MRLPYQFLSLLLLSVQLPAVWGHINLLVPLPINSKHDPQTPEAQIDYSYTSPLEKDGSNWPAKGYATKENFDRLNPVATLVAGETFEWTTEGTATHNGGSCQVGISYDLLHTVAVMASYIGGCPLKGKYSFKVPDLPGSKKALFWWSWVNRTGNRELYNNAAVVAVTGTAKSFTGPVPFRANSFPDKTCITTEGVDVVYPAPGDQIIYGGEYESNKPGPGKNLDNCPYDNSAVVTVTSDGSGSAAAPDKGEDEDKDKDSVQPSAATTMGPTSSTPDSSSSGSTLSPTDDVAAVSGTATTSVTSGQSTPASTSGSTASVSPTGGVSSDSDSDSNDNEPSSSPTNNNDDDDDKSQLGLWLGGIAAVMILLILIAAVVVVSKRRSTKKSQQRRHGDTSERHRRVHSHSRYAHDDYDEEKRGFGRAGRRTSATRSTRKSGRGSETSSSSDEGGSVSSSAGSRGSTSSDEESEDDDDSRRHRRSVKR